MLEKLGQTSRANTWMMKAWENTGIIAAVMAVFVLGLTAAVTNGAKQYMNGLERVAFACVGQACRPDTGGTDALPTCGAGCSTATQRLLPYTVVKVKDCDDRWCEVNEQPIVWKDGMQVPHFIQEEPSIRIVNHTSRRLRVGVCAKALQNNHSEACCGDVDLKPLDSVNISSAGQGSSRILRPALMSVARADANRGATPQVEPFTRSPSDVGTLQIVNDAKTNGRDPFSFLVLRSVMIWVRDIDKGYGCAPSDERQHSRFSGTTPVGPFDIAGSVTFSINSDGRAEFDPGSTQGITQPSCIFVDGRTLCARDAVAA